MPGDPDHCLASMGIYVFNDPAACSSCSARTPPGRTAATTSARTSSRAMIEHAQGVRLPVPRREPQGRSPYWRDVGTLDAYYQANMDLIEVDPVLNLYDRDWPIRTLPAAAAAAEVRLQRRRPAGHARRGEALDSMVCQGCIVSGGQVRRSILSPQRAGQQLRGGRGLDPVRRRRRRPALPHPPGDHRQGREDPAEHARSATTWSSTAGAASRSPSRGSWSIAKGETGATFLRS